jgi:hypothetical protein
MPDYVARVLRTTLQIGAAGGFTAIITEGAKLVPPQYAPMVLAVSVILVSFCQNLIEQATGKAILKPSDADVAKA